jgi:DNA-binding GntR family transcriptional regulator
MRAEIPKRAFEVTMQQARGWESPADRITGAFTASSADSAAANGRPPAVMLLDEQRRRPDKVGSDPMEHLQAIELRSAEQEVYEALRSEIIQGLAPGTPLRLATLASRFAVSTMPVRAALARLQAEGLVVQRPRRSAVVAGVSAEDFLDLYAIRMALEGVAARCGVPYLTDQHIADMYAHLERMRTLLKSGHPDTAEKYLRLDQHLHDICFNVSRRPQLISLIEVYRRQAERYFRLYLGRWLDVKSEVKMQEAWVEACKRRDPDGAEAATRALFDRTRQVLLPILQHSEQGQG